VLIENNISINEDLPSFQIKKNITLDTSFITQEKKHNEPKTLIQLKS